METELVLRVNQLDACELDDTITGVLEDFFLGIFGPLQSIRIDQFKPELKTILRYALWKFSLSSSSDSSTFGQRMLSLAYIHTNSRTLSSIQRAGLFYWYVLSEWVMERGDWLLCKLHPGDTPLRFLRHSSTAFKTLSVINFLVFLVYGCYPTLKERLLMLNMTPTTPQTLRTVSHRYLTREILWHGFTEFMFFVLPHFNLFTLRNVARKICSTKISTDNRLCSFCEGLPTNTQISNCGHLYCYYCLSANLTADPSFPCCVCNQLVNSMTPASETIS